MGPTITSITTTTATKTEATTLKTTTATPVKRSTRSKTTTGQPTARNHEIYDEKDDGRLHNARRSHDTNQEQFVASSNSRGHEQKHRDHWKINLFSVYVQTNRDITTEDIESLIQGATPSIAGGNFNPKNLLCERKSTKWNVFQDHRNNSGPADKRHPESYRSSPSHQDLLSTTIPEYPSSFQKPN